MLILRFALLCSLPGLLLPSPAAAQRWNDLEDALEGRELVLRPTFEGRRKVYLDAEDDRVFVLHRGDRLFPLRESETVRITDADPEDDHIELELQSARLGRGRVDVYGPARSGRPGSLLTLAPHRSGRAGSAASGSSTDGFATRRRVPAGPGSQAMATAIPKACLASSAIRCRDVETGPNLGVLAVFPSTGATCRCPLPSTGSRGLNSPASAVL